MSRDTPVAVCVRNPNDPLKLLFIPHSVIEDAIQIGEALWEFEVRTWWAEKEGVI